MILALLVYSLACFGLSFTLAYAKITLPMRAWLAALQGETGRGFFWWLLAWMECIACTGWWIGLGAALVGWRFAILPFTSSIGIAFWMIGLSFGSLAVNVLLGRFARLID